MCESIIISPFKQHFIPAGKSGLVAHRFASSLSSIGIASQFVQASEWIHGDLGMSGVCECVSICSVCVCACVCVCVCVCVYLCVHSVYDKLTMTCVHVCVCVYVCTCACMHSQT